MSISNIAALIVIAFLCVGISETFFGKRRK